MAAGVPFGKKNASQFSATKSFRPCSCAVGISGSVGERSLVVIVIAFAVLPSRCGIAAEALRQ